MSVAQDFTISSRQRDELERLVRARNTPQKVAVRARIVLLSAAQEPTGEIVEELSTTKPTIGLWRRRFREAGVEGLLQDAPRPGRIPKMSDREVARIVQATLTPPPHQTQWSTRTLAAKFGVSKDAVHRIWKAHGLKPHRVKTFKLSTDRNRLL